MFPADPSTDGALRTGAHARKASIAVPRGVMRDPRFRGYVDFRLATPNRFTPRNLESSIVS